MVRNNKFRHQERSLKRRAASLVPKPRILVLCEGVVTEFQYLDEFRRVFGSPLVEVEIERAGAVPKTLVERAAKRKKDAAAKAQREHDEFLKYDEIWCVFDVDDHPNLPDARQQARDNNIEVAISNPCFEIWLLLHFSDHNAHIERKQLAHLLKKYIPGYDKHISFGILQGGYSEAVARARRLEKQHEAAGPQNGNPSTNVHHLTEKIRGVGKAGAARPRK
jgi:hypothetical protein